VVLGWQAEPDHDPGKSLETVVAGLADGEDAGAPISFFRGSRARADGRFALLT
jgi:hypothetical protein